MRTRFILQHCAHLMNPSIVILQTAVVQIGEDTLEVMGGVEDKRYWVNGIPGEQKLEVSGMLPFTIGGNAVRFRFLDNRSFQIKIFLHDEQNIVLKAVKDFMRVDIENPQSDSFMNSAGLMGSFEVGGMLARDGKTEINNPNDFGIEWQVRADEPMLFHKVDGVQHPETCEMPSPVKESRRLEDSLSREQAQVACASVDKDDMEACVSDVMATNDVDMAGAF